LSDCLTQLTDFNGLPCAAHIISGGAAYLLYLDDSGSVNDPNSKFLVFAGISVFERQTHWLESHVNNIAARFNPAHPEAVELHAAPMRGAKDGWQHFSPTDRVQAVVDTLNLLSSTQSNVKVFAAVIEKSLLPLPQIIPHAFEKLADNFDSYLAAMYQRSQGKNPQRGIVIFDKSTFEQSIQGLSHVFKHHGHTNGYLRNFAEVPLFIDSKASRLIQIADMVAYWMYRRYEALDDRGFQLISPFFHSFSGGNQGLYELISPATVARLASIPVQAYPFPAPKPVGRRRVLTLMQRMDIHALYPAVLVLDLAGNSELVVFFRQSLTVLFDYLADTHSAQNRRSHC
jgi:hypothetical protein